MFKKINKHLVFLFIIFIVPLFLLENRVLANSTFQLEKKYNYYSNLSIEWCDIGEHLPVLRELAKECPRVTEIGIREIVSTWGILKGLIENPAATRTYLGIDIESPPIDNLQLVNSICAVNDIVFNFLKKNDLNIMIPPTDLLFIDSFHIYCHLTYELETFSPQVSKYIALHDTSEPWGDQDEGYNGNYSEYPVHIDRTKRGLWPAVVDFLASHPEWELYKRYTNCHGFTILKRVGSN